MAKPQLVLDSIVGNRGVNPRLKWIARHNPEMIVVTSSEHIPYYVETRNERYIDASKWGMSADELERFMRNEGPQYSYTTPSSFALSLWSRYFYPYPYHMQANGFRWRMCHDALYGGRCEVYKYGRGHYWQYDINSSYPYSAATLDFPDVRSMVYVKEPTLANIDKYEGVSTVVFSQYADKPPLPFRAANRTIYPEIDRLSGTYTHNELRYAMSVGVMVHSVTKQYIAERMIDNPFNDFVTYCYNRRSEGKVWKQIMNCLFGRLAVGKNTLLRFSIASSREQLLQRPRHLKDYFGANMVATEFNPPPNGNVFWSAMILADARARLHLHISYADYVDTDCLMYPFDPQLPCSSDIGSFKLRDGIYDFRGAKAYLMTDNAGNDIIKLKGVATETRTISDLYKAKTTNERLLNPDGTTRPYQLNTTTLSELERLK